MQVTSTIGKSREEKIMDEDVPLFDLFRHRRHIGCIVQCASDVEVLVGKARG